MNEFEALIENVPVLEEKLGYTFKDKKLLLLAFVHRSYFNEHREQMQEHNERLEFLGDSVLGLLVSDYLYRSLPNHAEGVLSHLRSQIVESPTCAAFIEKLGLGSAVLLGKGEKRGNERGRETIWADLFEALMGAIYLDGGVEEARMFLMRHFQEDIEKILGAPTRNWKAELQDYSQKRYQKPPMYKVVKEIGPDHSKIFHIEVMIEDLVIGEGNGSSKKEAEQIAAENAIKRLTENE